MRSPVFGCWYFAKAGKRAAQDRVKAAATDEIALLLDPAKGSKSKAYDQARSNYLCRVNESTKKVSFPFPSSPCHFFQTRTLQEAGLTERQRVLASLKLEPAESIRPGARRVQG
jgi:hypothetical protein